MLRQLANKRVHMKKILDFDKVKSTVKDYFGGYYNELKTDKSSLKKFIIVSVIEFVLLAFTIVFDLCMKDFLFKFLLDKTGLNYTVAEGFLDLTYSENTGAGFGSFKGNAVLLAVITGIVIVLMLGYLIVAKRQNMWLRISLVLVSGGGIGNLVDRVNLGYVRDFFEFTFMDFAIFNVADFFVTIGSFMLIFYLIYLIAIDVKHGKKAKDKTSVTAEYDEMFESAKESKKHENNTFGSLNNSSTEEESE